MAANSSTRDYFSIDMDSVQLPCREEPLFGFTNSRESINNLNDNNPFNNGGGGSNTTTTTSYGILEGGRGTGNSHHQAQVPFSSSRPSSNSSFSSTTPIINRPNNYSSSYGGYVPSVKFVTSTLKRMERRKVIVGGFVALTVILVLVGYSMSHNHYSVKEVLKGPDSNGDLVVTIKAKHEKKNEDYHKQEVAAAAPPLLKGAGAGGNNQGNDKDDTHHHASNYQNDSGTATLTTTASSNSITTPTPPPPPPTPVVAAVTSTSSAISTSTKKTVKESPNSIEQDVATTPITTTISTGVSTKGSSSNSKDSLKPSASGTDGPHYNPNATCKGNVVRGPKTFDQYPKKNQKYDTLEGDPISLIHEMLECPTFVEEECQHNRTHGSRVKVFVRTPLLNQPFLGYGKTFKEAKKHAAYNAAKVLYPEAKTKGGLPDQDEIQKDLEHGRCWTPKKSKNKD